MEKWSLTGNELEDKGLLELLAIRKDREPCPSRQIIKLIILLKGWYAYYERSTACN